MELSLRYKWTLPITGHKVVGSVLGMELIVQTMQAFADQRVRMSLELAAAMIQEVDGKPLEDVTARREFLGSLPPKEQNLLVEAYNRLHNADKAEADAFFLGQEVLTT